METTVQKRARAIRTLSNFDLEHTKKVYALVERTPRGNHFIRFFMVTSDGDRPSIVEITSYVGHLTPYRLVERKGAFFIATRGSDYRDVARSLSEELFGSENALQTESL